MSGRWIDMAAWDHAVIPRWKLILLRIRYPRSWFVRRNGHVYIIREVPTPNDENKGV